jgi:hypothetical protein
MADRNDFTPLEAAILRTVLYADVFNFPLTAAEIQHFLIHDAPTSLAAVETALRHSIPLTACLILQDGYIACADKSHLIALRREREAASARLWPLARQYGIWLGRLPFVRMVALTGALAVRNAAADTDDLDYMLVTAANRVWLARAFAILLVRLARQRGLVLCPNYVLAEDALEQARKDLFIAHEITQMIPLYGHLNYWQFRAANGWTNAVMPNAAAPFYPEPAPAEHALWTYLKQILESVLAGSLGNWLERWEYRRKLARFASDMQTPHSAAVLDQSQVKGHFNDYGHLVLRQYHERLCAYGLDSQPVPHTESSNG